MTTTVTAAELLNLMMNATPEMIDEITRSLGPCDGALMVREALLMLSELREVNERGHF